MLVFVVSPIEYDSSASWGVFTSMEAALAEVQKIVPAATLQEPQRVGDNFIIRLNDGRNSRLAIEQFTLDTPAYVFYSQGDEYPW